MWLNTRTTSVQGIKHYAIFVVHYNYNYIPKICSALHYNYIFCTTTTITITHYIYKDGRGGPPKLLKFWAFLSVSGNSENLIFWAEKLRKFFKKILQFLGQKTSKTRENFSWKSNCSADDICTTITITITFFALL